MFYFLNNTCWYIRTYVIYDLRWVYMGSLVLTACTCPISVNQYAKEKLKRGV